LSVGRDCRLQRCLSGRTDRADATAHYRDCGADTDRYTGRDANAGSDCGNDFDPDTGSESVG
jgi:hypothetical protein